MKGESKSKEKLLNELEALRRRIAELEKLQNSLVHVEDHNRRLASFPRLNPNPILEVDTAGEITFFNQATEKALEALGMDKRNHSVFLPEDLPTSLKDWDQKEETVLYREVVLNNRVFSESIYFVPQHNTAHIYAIDITEKKQVEEALQKSENRFRRITENARDIIYRMSFPDGRYEYVSPAVLDIIGFTPEDLYDGTFSLEHSIHPDFAEYFNQQWENLLQREEVPLFYEFKIIHKNGSERWLHQRNAPVRNKKGSLIAIEGIATDITELKRAEEELKKHSDMLEKLVKERTAELERKSSTVEELNVALKVLLHQVQEDNENLEQRLASNVKTLVLPYLERILKSHLDEQQRTCLDIIQTNLHEIISPFLHNIQKLNLTPREIQVANLVKEGKTTKEIASIVGVATNAIDSYRNSIRTKLDLKKKKVNLQSYLQSLK